MYAAHNVKIVAGNGYNNVVSYLDSKGRDTLILENGRPYYRTYYNDNLLTASVTMYNDSTLTNSVEFYNANGDIIKLYSLRNDTVYYAYSYDSLNRMISRDKLFKGHATYNTFTYNDKGQLRAISGTCHKQGRDSLGVVLHYNNKGQLYLTHIHENASIADMTVAFGSYVADSIQYSYYLNGLVKTATYCENQMGRNIAYRHKAVFNYKYNRKGLLKTCLGLYDSQRRRTSYTYTYRK